MKRFIITIILFLPGLLSISARKERLHFVVDSVRFDMVLVEGGKFTMGATAEQTGYSDDEHPLQEVELSDFYIADTEVTQALWTTIMGANPSLYTGNLQNPVEWVSFFDVQLFLSKLNALFQANFSLPTEAQWEYAARGGNRSQFFRYSGSDDVEAVAWCGAMEPESERAFTDTVVVGSFLSSERAHTYPVAQKLPNELGLYDMSGNVAEWTSTFYAPYTKKRKKNPKGPREGSFIAVRGGCWCLGPYLSRVSARIKVLPQSRYTNLGFRLMIPAWSEAVPRYGSSTIVAERKAN